MSPKKVNPQKTSLIGSLKDLISQSKSIAVVDYKGLKVNQATELRRAIHHAGGQIIVAKNTLFSLASGNTNLNLTGPSAFIFSLTDEISAIKAVADFAKKNALPTFKLGFLGSQALSQEQIVSLASLPGKDVLLGQAVSSLSSPLFRLVYSLNWNISKLVRTLDAVKGVKFNVR